jgi:DNA-binding MarR family transcriptional regulator
LLAEAPELKGALAYHMKIEEEIKQKKFHSVYQKAVLNLIFTANWLVSSQQKFFACFGVTPQQFNILRILKGQHPKAISATEIKSRMLDRNSDVSRLLDRLVKKDLVSKRTSPADRRATDVCITDKGILLLDEIGKGQKKIDNLLSLTEAEAELLSNLLDKSRS